VLVMDNRGHGRSQAPADRTAYSILHMADDVEAVVAEAGFERYHLLGHSMGGAVVQEIALRSPGRIISLTLHDTSYRFGITRSEAAKKIHEARIRIAEEQGMAAVAAIKFPVPDPPFMTEERKAETAERLARMSVDGFVGAAHALTEWSGVAERLAEIVIPTMVIYGDLDTTLIEPSKRLAERIRGAVLEVVPQAGHSPQYERPELFNAALRRHLDRNAGAGAK
jgi:pimeloyl-ACP methyl ester carboxylesterase